MRVIALCLIISAAFLSPGPEANSAVRCQVQPKSVEGSLRKSAAVFVGEVMEINDASSLKEVRLRVDRSWKGIETEEVIVLVTRTSESPRYAVGERYLVFANLQDGKLLTGNCSRTKRIEYADEDLQQLGEGKKVKGEFRRVQPPNSSSNLSP